TPQIAAAAVASSPLHTHSSSGLIHVEPDRPGTYTLGQFFDEWGVRLDARCIGGYCAGGGKELRAYVDGRRIDGDPRKIVLGNRQEIALVFGGPGDFAELPAYHGGWPGGGCGGEGEASWWRANRISVGYRSTVGEARPVHPDRVGRDRVCSGRRPRGALLPHRGLADDARLRARRRVDRPSLRRRLGRRQPESERAGHSAR